MEQKKIFKTSAETRETLKKRSAYSLPNRPSASGMTAEQIKKHFWQPLLADDASIITELDRIVDAANECLQNIYNAIESGTIPGDTEGLKELIEELQALANAASEKANQAAASAQQASQTAARVEERVQEIAGSVQDFEKSVETLNGAVDALNTGKVNVADIINNLVSSAANKPLSAAQGVVLKGLIDAITVPTKTSQLENDSGYLTQHQDLSAYAKKSTTLAGYGITDATTKLELSAHNTDEEAHNDLRLRLDECYSVLKRIADSTDEDLDQLSEMVAYIKSNRSLIENITTEKVNKADIIDNLVTNLSNKVLSAAQGVVLKGLIDQLSANKLNASAIADDLTTNDSAKVLSAAQGVALKALIDGLTTSKISTADIANNLTTSSATKVLSAAQGVALKSLIDALTTNKLNASDLPTAVNQALAQAKASGEFDGKDGDPGKTPVKGVDYWTPEDKEEIENDNKAFISQELAKRGQLKPEFANSIEECTDSSKLYVLPDGYIYAYVISWKEATNQIPISTDANGNIYNGIGYKSSTRLSSSNGGDSTTVGSYAIGYMPCKLGGIIRLENMGFRNATVNDLSAANQRICFYDSSKAFICATNANAVFSSGYLNGVTNNEGDIIQLTVENFASYDLTNAAYFRISGYYVGDDTVITVNEEISGGTSAQWTNTGHAFVPADYEDEIVNLEDRTKSLESRTTSLEKRIDDLSVGEGDTFTYIITEAQDVAKRVQSNRTVGSLTFTAMSDPHVEVDTTNEYGLKNNLTSCRDAGIGLTELQKYLKLDFTAMLGDYTWGDSAETVAQVKKDLTYVKECMTEGMKGIPNIWCTGNHDINYGKDSDRRMTEDELYAYLTSNNKDTIQDSNYIGRNYGYIDFENQKIRCIYLNTVDVLDYPDNPTGTADKGDGVTAIQTQWLANTGLNLSTKANSTEWGIVILSHHCLSLYQHITKVLTAYKDGTSGSVDVTTNGVTTTVTYNFSSVNRGEIICAIHGHNHNFIKKKISDELYSQITNGWLWSIGVPNMDTTRNNEVAKSEDANWKNAFGDFDESGNPVYYSKTQGTATSTSFCVFTIDRKNRKVYAIAYGAGIDREISY